LIIALHSSSSAGACFAQLGAAMGLAIMLSLWRIAECYTVIRIGQIL